MLLSRIVVSEDGRQLQNRSYAKPSRKQNRRRNPTTAFPLCYSASERIIDVSATITIKGHGLHKSTLRTKLSRRPAGSVDLDGCGYCFGCRFCLQTVSLTSSESRTCWRDHHGGRVEPEEPADLCAHGRLPREIPTSATWASYWPSEL